MLRYTVTAVVDYVVEIDPKSDCPARDAEAIVRNHLDDDDLVFAYSSMPRTEPFEQEIG